MVGNGRNDENRRWPAGCNRKSGYTVLSWPGTEKRPPRNEAASKINPGSDLLSHTPAHAVPSAVTGLTSVFGMGTGVTLPL